VPDMLRHLRFAVRSLRRSPAFTLSAVLTLALCMGANVAVFSIVDTLLVRPLPYADAHQLVLIEKGAAWGPDHLRLDAARWIHEMRSFSSVGLFATGTLNLGGGDEPVHLKAAMVSPGFFAALGINPVLGRTLQADDHAKGGAYAVVLGHNAWRRFFAGDRSVPGRTVTINGRPTLVVGVMPPGFDFPDASEVWVPATLAETPFYGAVRGRFIARMRPGVTPEQARTEGERAAHENMTKLPSTYQFLVVPLAEVLYGPIRPALLLFLAAVAGVLLIGCANVANLVLARMNTRKGELAIRAALGAGRAALVGQALVEIAAVALVGAVLGLALAKLSLATLLSLMPPDVPGLERAGVDARAAVFALGLSLLAVLLVGLVAAARMGRLDLRNTGSGSAREVPARHRRLPRALVIGEMALAILLSSGAALLARSFFQLANVHPGFEPQRVLTMTLSTMNRTYRTSPGISAVEAAKIENDRVVKAYREITERILSVPGVEQAAAADRLPMNDRLPMKVTFEDDGREIQAVIRCVTPGFFSTMKIPLVAGRDFSAAGDGGAAVIVSRNLARRLWGKDWVPGQRLRFRRDGPGVEVIGVAGDVRSLGPEQPPPFELYEPHVADPFPVMSLAVRTRIDPRALTAPIREQIRSVDPSVPVFRVQTMERVMGAMLAPRRTSMLVLGLFAACAVLLAATGVYGVTSYVVGQRTREFGIRLALGARASQVLAGVVRQSALDAAIAAVLGLAGALALGRLLKSFLVNVAPTDPLVLGVTALALVAIGVASSLAPAFRASSVDPATTLRGE
jgi:putative ABC transport system permease protein